jgi:methyl-accepting chemotaxis protein
MEALQIKERYYQKVGKVMLGITLAHLPIFILVAWIFETEYSIAAGLATFFLIPQAVAYFKKPKSPLSLYLFSFIIMSYSGILIHLGKGMIEMHFHVFVFIPITALFGLYMAPVIAAATIAVHHIAFYFLLPESLFNYQASFYIVLLHAAFVVIETAIAIYVCAKFKDFIQKQVFVETKLADLSSSFQMEGDSLKNLANEISQQSHKQSEYTQQTSSATFEIKNISDKNLSHVQNSVHLIDNSDQKVKQGRDVLENVNQVNQKVHENIMDIINTLKKVNEEFKEFQQFMDDISDKTKIINDIVFQTKLLSFNASVEAARAGEHGKGFSVVAEEIGSLAQNSGGAASEINTIVSNSITKFTDLLSYIEDLFQTSQNTTLNAVNESSENQKRVNQVFEEIEVTFKSLKDSLYQLESATQEQNHGIEEITSSIQNIETLSNETKDIASKNLDSSQTIVDNNVLLGEFIQSFQDKKKAS